MSIGSLITGGLGSFSSVPLLLLDGLGAFPTGPTGGGDYAQWEVPPFGQRRVWENLGTDLRARREALLNEARREIGLLKDDEPVPLVIEEITEEIAAIEATVMVPPPVIFDKAAYAAAIARTLRATMMAEDAAHTEWMRRDDEAVLLLVAAVI